jgi:hypothetical protein
MMIQFRCACGQLLEAEEASAGQRTICPACGKEVLIRGPEVVPAVLPVVRAEGDRPARRRPRSDEDEDRPPAHRGTSGKAITAFVLGLLSFCVPVVLSLVAIILGALGLGEIGRSRGRLGGKGLAITGMVLGVLTMLVSPVAFFFVWRMGMARVHEATGRVQNQNNLRLIGLALIEYQNDHRRLPPSAVYNKDGTPLYSWRVLILPQLGRKDLFDKFDLEAAWDSPQNKRLLDQMPDVYASPLHPESAGRDQTHYQVIVGRDTGPGARPIWVDNSRDLEPFNPQVGRIVQLFQTRGAALSYPGAITDGCKFTILVAEAAEPVPWTKPADLSYSAKGPLPSLGNPARSTFTVVTAESVPHNVPAQVSEQSLRAAITANANDIVGRDFEDWP